MRLPTLLYLASLSLLDNNGKEIAFIETDSDGHCDINIDRDANYYAKIKKDNNIENTSPVKSKNIN